MKAIEKIRNYIQEEKNQGRLRPGDALPSYHRMMDLCGASYATVSSAMAKLEKEGLVDIKNGTGTFLAGARPFTVIVYCKPNVIPLETLKCIFEKNISRNNLCINVKVEKLEKMSPLSCTPDVKASISIVPSSFYDKLTRFSYTENEFTNPEHPNEIATNFIDCLIPFNVFSYQMAVNQIILDRIGFNAEQLHSDFSWWPGYVKRCRENKIMPAAMNWPVNTRWHFNILLPLLFSIVKNIDPAFDFGKSIKAPFFDSDTGRLFFKIIKDCYLHNSPVDPKSFYRNGAGFHFQVGSWVCVQNKDSKYPNINVDGLKIIPYKHKNRKICALQQNYLFPTFSESINTEEKKRVEKLLDVMLAREFQLEYCNLSGAISQCTDISPLDYSWNSDDRFSAFFPDKNDYIFFEGVPFQPSAISCLTMFVEEFCIYNAPMKITLKKMDRKIS